MRYNARFMAADRIVVNTTKYISYVSAFCMIVVAFLSTGDVIAAKVFGKSIPASTEIIEYMLVPMVYLGLARAHLDFGMVSVDLFNKILPRWLTVGIRLFGNLLGAVIAGFLAHCGWKLLLTYFEHQTRSSTASASFLLWPVVGLFVLGLITWALAFVWAIVRQFAKKDSGDSFQDHTDEGGLNT